jgi:hypothetical protein
LDSLGASTAEFALRNVLVRMRDGVLTVDRLQDEIAVELERIRTVPPELWTFIFPVNAVPRDSRRFGKRKFTVGRHQVVWTLWSTFWHERGQHIPEAQWKQVNLRTIWSAERSNLEEYSYLTTQTSARDQGHALATAFNVAELFVSLLSLSNSFGVSRMSSEEAPLTRIQSPKGAFIFDRLGNYFGFDSRGDLPREVERLSVDNMRLLKSAYANYKMTMKSDLGGVMSESIVLYHRAVSDETFAFAFLKLWMGLEKMMLMKQGMKEEEVIRRISNIFMLPHKVNKPLMEILLKKRNTLVHEGTVGKIHRTDVNYIKWLFEIVFSALLRQSQLKRTRRQLEIFLRFVGVNEAELKDNRKIASYVLEWRTERPPRNPRPT